MNVIYLKPEQQFTNADHYTSSLYIPVDKILYLSINTYRDREDTYHVHFGSKESAIIDKENFSNIINFIEKRTCNESHEKHYDV